MDPDGPKGVLLINLGTPDSPTTRDVRRYLREFLSDPRVIDIPAPARWLLLNAVILPFRPKRSAAQYASVWTREGSPLLVASRALRDRLAKELGDDYAVELGMRYGSPSIANALERLSQAGVQRAQVFPLFPQYSEAATGSALAKVREENAAHGFVAKLDTVEDFYDEPGFIASWAAVARPELDAFSPDHVLLSYHGLPERQVQRTDESGSHCLATESCCSKIVAANRRCYRAHCFATTRGIVGALGLVEGEYTTSFQSRLGRTPWIRPYTDHVLPVLAQNGVRRLAVLCPAFTADCLETIEEIGIRARDQWKEVGGDAIHLVPSLNDHPRWVETLAGWIRGR